MAAPLTAVALDCDLCHVNLLFRLCLLGVAKRVQKNVARRNRFPGWGWLSRYRRGLVSDPTREPRMATASPSVSPKIILVDVGTVESSYSIATQFVVTPKPVYWILIAQADFNDTQPTGVPGWLGDVVCHF